MGRLLREKGVGWDIHSKTPFNCISVLPSLSRLGGWGGGGDKKIQPNLEGDGILKYKPVDSRSDRGERTSTHTEGTGYKSRARRDTGGPEHRRASEQCARSRQAGDPEMGADVRSRTAVRQWAKRRQVWRLGHCRGRIRKGQRSSQETCCRPSGRRQEERADLQDLLELESRFYHQLDIGSEETGILTNKLHALASITQESWCPSPRSRWGLTAG